MDEAAAGRLPWMPLAKVTLESARTTEADPERAADELLRQLGGATPKLVTLFGSADRDQRALNAAVRARLPSSTRLIGASTGGELDNRGIHRGSVLLGALSGDFDIGIGVGTRLGADAVGAGMRAIARASDELGIRPADLDPRQTVGLVIDDGFKSKKEELLLGVLDKNPALTLVGGGANGPEPDPSRFSAFVHLDGEVTDDAVLVALFKTRAPWGALRSHWYLPSGERLRITKVDDTCMRALEIDGKPAAQRYAEIIGVSLAELDFDKPTGFGARPTALRVGREYFIRAPWKPLPDGSILFANLLDEDTELEIMQIGDIAELTQQFFVRQLPDRVPNPRAALLFHCSGRDWLARSMGQFDRLSATMQYAPPAAGLNVFFEIYSGFHINTTLTVLAFGENDA